MKNLDDMPVACSLTVAELRDRNAMILSQFRSTVVETEELQDGYAFRLPSQSESIRLAANLIAAERECCSFLTFSLVAHHNKGQVIVRVTGPSGTKQILRTLLCRTSECN